MNLFEQIPSRLTEELVQTIVNSSHVRIERIVSRGHTSPDGFWYEQDQAEWVVVLSGHATLEFEDGTLPMQQGDHILLPAGKRHRVEATSLDEPTIWLAVHFDDADSNRGVISCMSKGNT